MPHAARAADPAPALRPGRRGGAHPRADRAVARPVPGARAPARGAGPEEAGDQRGGRGDTQGPELGTGHATQVGDHAQRQRRRWPRPPAGTRTRRPPAAPRPGPGRPSRWPRCVRCPGTMATAWAQPMSRAAPQPGSGWRARGSVVRVVHRKPPVTRSRGARQRPAPRRAIRGSSPATSTKRDGRQRADRTSLPP